MRWRYGIVTDYFLWGQWHPVLVGYRADNARVWRMTTPRDNNVCPVLTAVKLATPRVNNVRPVLTAVKLATPRNNNVRPVLTPLKLATPWDNNVCLTPLKPATPTDNNVLPALTNVKLSRNSFYQNLYILSSHSILFNLSFVMDEIHQYNY